MEIVKINRNYSLHNLKFISSYRGYREKEYQKLCDGSKYEKMKEIFIPYSEDKLHVIATYMLLTKHIIPIVSIIVGIVGVYLNNLILLGISAFMLILSAITYLLLRNHWRLSLRIYSLEITAIDGFLSEKYGTEFRSDFEEFGEMYLKGDL